MLQSMFVVWKLKTVLPEYGMRGCLVSGMVRFLHSAGDYIVQRWCRTSDAVVRQNGNISCNFNLSRGMKQGTALSSLAFTIHVFVDELLLQFQNK